MNLLMRKYKIKVIKNEKKIYEQKKREKLYRKIMCSTADFISFRRFVASAVIQ